MDEIKLEQANKLQSKIKEISTTLFHWQQATRLYDDAINVHYSYRQVNDNYPDGYDIRNNSYKKVSPETFTVVKALNIDYWQRELDRLEKEFNEL